MDTSARRARKSRRKRPRTRALATVSRHTMRPRQGRASYLKRAVLLRAGACYILASTPLHQPSYVHGRPATARAAGIAHPLSAADAVAMPARAPATCHNNTANRSTRSRSTSTKRLVTFPPHKRPSVRSVPQLRASVRRAAACATHPVELEAARGTNLGGAAVIISNPSHIPSAELNTRPPGRHRSGSHVPSTGCYSSRNSPPSRCRC